MAPRRPNKCLLKPNPTRTKTTPLTGTEARPFLQTGFGKLPPELREKVYVELLATPPSYGGHDFISCSSEVKRSPAAPKKFVHISASWYQVTRTCRQIYLESYTVFFAANSYYLATPRAVENFLKFSGSYFPNYIYPFLNPILRWDSITAVCFGDLVEVRKMYTEEEIEKFISNSPRYGTREQLEARTYKNIDSIIYYHLGKLSNLKTVGLRIRVGEEMLYINVLYGISGFRKGLVEFLDESHWLIRRQNPEDVWKTQYAGFAWGDFAKDRNDERIPYDAVWIERDVTDIDSRAPGLKEGDQRYIEVEIRRPTVKIKTQAIPYRVLKNIDWESAPLYTGSNPSNPDSDQPHIDWESAPLYNGSDPSNQDSDQPQLDLPQDQPGSNAPAELSEDDISTAELEPEPDSTGSTPLTGLQEEASQDFQLDTGTDPEEDIHSLEPASEGDPDTQTSTQSSPPQDAPFSVAFESEIQITPTETGHDRSDPLTTDNVNKQIQPDASTSDPTPQITDLQPSFEPPAQKVIEADKIHEAPKPEVRKRIRRTKPIYLSSRSTQPLQAVCNAPNPYTDEEMESYENWQQLSVAGNRVYTKIRLRKEQKTSSPSDKEHEAHERDSSAASKAVTPKDLRAVSKAATPSGTNPSSTSPEHSGSHSASVLILTLCALLLILVIMSLSPEWLSSTHRDAQRPGQQLGSSVS